MKKLVLAMACVLSLGLLASCKNGTQDVNLKNQAKTEVYSAKGTVTFTAAAKAQGTEAFGSKTWVAGTANQSLAGSEVVQFSTVEKDVNRDSVDANYEQYKLTIAFAYCANTTATTPSYSYGTKEINLYKIGDKWYTDDANRDANYNAERKAVVEFSEGDPTGNFTIKSLGVVDFGSTAGLWEVTGLKFTKAE